MENFLPAGASEARSAEGGLEEKGTGRETRLAQVCAKREGVQVCTTYSTRTGIPWTRTPKGDHLDSLLL
jgi:hypothetical protein